MHYQKQYFVQTEKNKNKPHTGFLHLIITKLNCGAPYKHKAGTHQEGRPLSGKGPSHMPAICTWSVSRVGLARGW